MSKPTTIKMPSGATLVVALASFAESKELYQVMMKEGKTLKIDGKTDLDYNFFKDGLCAFLSSKEVEAALWECMKRCTYNKMKIDEDTFEPEEAREDYMIVMYEVAMANLKPFLKGLSAQFGTLIGEILGKPLKP
jgi:hypothetical protein